MEIKPNQVSYLSPFCDDTPTEIGKWIQVYNLFVRKGDEYDTGYNSSRMSSIFSDIPFASGRIYDPQDLSFQWTRTGASGQIFDVTGGAVVINNTIIELGDFSLNIYETDARWSPSGMGTWSFASNATTYCYMCVIFEPYLSAGVIDTDEPSAFCAFVREQDIDFEIMAPLWCVKVQRDSGGNIVSGGTSLYLEHSELTYKIEQLGYWKEFIVDGGDLG